MKKLSKNQQDLLDHLRDGWELGSSNIPAGIRYWLQKPKLCCGGQSINVHANTARSLLRSGILIPFRKKGDAYWLTRYRIVK